MVFPEFPSDAWEYIKGPLKQRVETRKTSVRAATLIANRVRGSIARARYWTVKELQRFYNRVGVYSMEALEFMNSLDRGRMTEAMSRVDNPRWGLSPSWHISQLQVYQG